MTRGITETDVWTACDALLLSGARPTIERVRQHVGRGSPNTVGPYLDTWFKGLGARIQDPAAFAAPSDVPDPVHQASKHLWEVAQAEARRDIHQRVADGVAEAAALAHVCEVRALQAEAALEDAGQAAHRLEQDLVARGKELEQAHRDQAAERARLEEVRIALAASNERVKQLEAQMSAALTDAARQIAAAVERADAADRRVALELERERSARTKAERAAVALADRLEVIRNEGATAAEAAQRKLDAAHEQVSALNAQLAIATTELVQQRAQLQDVRHVAEADARTARDQSAALQQSLDRLTAILEARRPRAAGARSKRVEGEAAMA
jgi:hypothetical protein